MGFPLTEEQRAAVEDCGGGLLVSAAAGSGKTRVLVERLLSRVEEEGLDIHRFLVITYTKAAAAELRGRIVEELAARLAERLGTAICGGRPRWSIRRRSLPSMRSAPNSSGSAGTCWIWTPISGSVTRARREC